VSTVQKDGAVFMEHESRSPYHQTKLLNNLICMDSTDALAVVGGTDGALLVYSDLDQKNPVIMRNLKGHVADVNTVKFFPSKTVVLSGGGDMLLKIWTLSTNEGLCAADLKGHKKGVLCCDIVDIGRNVLSSSRDGTCIHWDVPTQTPIHRWGTDLNLHAVNACAVVDHPQEVSGKLVLVASESGQFLAFDMRQQHQVFSCTTGKPLNCCCGFNNYVMCGSQDSIVRTYDLRNVHSSDQSGTTTTSLASINLNAGPITKLLKTKNRENHCFIGTGNGLICEWNVTSKDNITKSTLVSDTEPIHALVLRGEEVAAASRRGAFRIYNIPHL